MRVRWGGTKSRWLDEHPLSPPGGARATVPEQTLQSMATPRFALDFLMASFICIFSWQWCSHVSRSAPSWQCWCTALVSPRIAFNFFMAELFCHGGIAKVSGGHFLPQWHPPVRGQVLHGGTLFPAVASPWFAVKLLVAAFIYCSAIPTVRCQVLHGGTFFPAVASARFAGELFVAALLLPRWHPHGSPSTSSWRHLFLPRWHPHGSQSLRGQVLHGGILLPRWHPHGSRSNSSWRHSFTAVASPRFAVKFFMAAFFYRGGIPTVRGQPLRRGTLFTAVASPRFAVGSRMGLVRSSRPLLLMLVDVVCVCVDGSDWYLKPSGRR